MKLTIKDWENFWYELAGLLWCCPGDHKEEGRVFINLIKKKGMVGADIKKIDKLHFITGMPAKTMRTTDKINEIINWVNEIIIKVGG